MPFLDSLKSELCQSLANCYTDNYDYHRFGQYDLKRRAKEAIKELRRQSSIVFSPFSKTEDHLLSPLKKNLAGLNDLYEKLNDQQSKDLLIKILAFRALGFRKVKLPTNSPDYWQTLKAIESQADYERGIDLPFSPGKLPLLDISKWGYPIRFYYTPLGVMMNFVLKQYEYKDTEGRFHVSAKPGDTLLDCGACWGDTALYFANLVGSDGRVYSFEFVPSNMEIFTKNTENNPSLKPQITLVPKAVWNTSDQSLYCLDQGPGSRVSFAPKKNYRRKTETISIDNFCHRNALSKVDFIKMDIEGAENFALRGAEKTIQKNRPTLAISVYHRIEDFVTVPNYILSIVDDYQFFLKHATIHSEETILFAVPREKMKKYEI